MTLHARQLTLGYGRVDVVTDLDLEVPERCLTVLIGPNGCGKSTILRGLAGLLPARSGSVHVGGQPLAAMAPKGLARQLSVLPQAPLTPEGIAVKELVARGRHPHQRLFSPWSQADEQAVIGALEAVDLLQLAETPVESLSGGQRQRAWVALVLAQGSSHILLDEPTTYLDLAHAVEVMDVVHRAAHVDGKTVLVVLHDLNLAARYADHLVVIAEGRVAAAGSPQAVLTEGLLDTVFGLAAKVLDVDGAPVVVPTGAGQPVVVPTGGAEPVGANAERPVTPGHRGP